jgi:hypothetical protein
LEAAGGISSGPAGVQAGSLCLCLIHHHTCFCACVWEGHLGYLLHSCTGTSFGLLDFRFASGCRILQVALFWICSAQLSSAQLSSTRLDSTRLDLALLCSGLLCSGLCFEEGPYFDPGMGACRKHGRKNGSSCAWGRRNEHLGRADWRVRCLSWSDTRIPRLPIGILLVTCQKWTKDVGKTGTR